MKSKKKMLAVTLGAISSIALIGGSVFAMETHRRADRETAPISSTKAVAGEGESYTDEELAKKMGISVDELNSQLKTYEFPITGALKVTGEVKNDVHMPAASTMGEGESYTDEELAKKMGITLGELKSRTKTKTFDLKNAEKGSPIQGYVSSDE